MLKDNKNNENDEKTGGGAPPSAGQAIGGFAGAAGANAFGIPPEIGNIVGGLLGGGIGSLFGKKGETRPGGRTPSGWGVQPHNTIDGYKFTSQAQNFEIVGWGRRVAFWMGADDTEYEGYKLLRNGSMIHEHAVYLWIEGGRLYVQGNLTPWDDDATAGTVQIYLGGNDKIWGSAGRGLANNPKAINVRGASSSTQPAPFSVTMNNATPTIGYGNNIAPSSIDYGNNIAPPPSNGFTGATPQSNGFVGGTPPINPFANQAKGKSEKDKEKKDNTLAYIGIGAGALIVITLILVFARK
ncbi:hypothetical protein JKY72_01565 [Candidatus Gracilibacteria bacterium]|nr:hypothetical protein [Candidatus Gracilibacteria bacterium]